MIAPAIKAFRIQGGSMAAASHGLSLGKVLIVFAAGMALFQIAFAPPEAGAQKLPVTGVPRVLGMKFEDAKAKLEKEGFKCLKAAKDFPTSDINQAGKVGSQLATGMTPTMKGTVELTLYAYKGTVKESIVPNFVGLSYKQAEQDMAKYKFLAEISDIVVDDPKLSNGVIRNQQYAVGTKLPEGTRIRLTGHIYRLMPNVTVPDVRNITKDEAYKRIVAAGIAGVSTQLRTTAQKEKDGIVLDQNPAPGSPMLQGYPVLIIVWKYEAAAIEAYCNYIAGEKVYIFSLRGGTPPFDVSIQYNSPGGSKLVDVVPLKDNPQQPGLKFYRLIPKASVKVTMTVKEANGKTHAYPLDLKLN